MATPATIHPMRAEDAHARELLAGSVIWWNDSELVSASVGMKHERVGQTAAGRTSRTSVSVET